MEPGIIKERWQNTREELERRNFSFDYILYHDHTVFPVRSRRPWCRFQDPWTLTNYIKTNIYKIQDVSRLYVECSIHCIIQYITNWGNCKSVFLFVRGKCCQQLIFHMQQKTQDCDGRKKLSILFLKNGNKKGASSGERLQTHRQGLLETCL